MTYRQARRGARRQHRSGHAFAATVTTAIGLFGAVLLAAGSLQVIRTNLVSGIPVAAPITHLAGVAAPNLHTTVPATSTAPPVTAESTTAAPPASHRTQVSAPATQPVNTIRLPQGDFASLVHEQVATNGELPIPSGVSQATWWGVAFDAVAGATVFAGHVNWAGVTGPFAELWHDAVGGSISVVDGTGRTWSFRVSQVLTVNKDQLPAQAPSLFSASGPRRIVLVTCGGEWVGGQEGYNENRVLIADPVG